MTGPQQTKSMSLEAEAEVRQVAVVLEAGAAEEEEGIL